jgi:CheY-like chemotaxis protein
MGEGTGLGLSTTAAIVKSHEGFIDVETEAGRGTAFKVFLPAHTSAVPAAVSLEPDMPEGQGQLVLMIDDEAAILNIARETLEVYGYAVVTASSGEDALAIFRERGKDIRLAVTDMSMPGLGGAATIQALRAIDPAVLIVATSGRPLEEPSPAVQGFLPKPYSARTLLETVQAAMAGR